MSEKKQKNRLVHYDSAACYLKVDGKVLMLKYYKKWGKVYTPPGGKFEEGETPLDKLLSEETGMPVYIAEEPLDCVVREFLEETGLTLINPRLQGISCWKDSYEGIIYIFVATSYEGELTESEEGKLEWIDEKDLKDINQFSQNQKFVSYLFQPEIFEGKFLLDENCQVIDYMIRTI